MILTCPTCVTRYHVDGAAFPAEGRTVRCASCAHSWRALKCDLEDEAMELSPGPAFAATAPATPSAAVAAAEPATPAPLPKIIRAKAKAERDTRQAMTTGAVWAMLGAAFLVVLGGAALFRVQVVRLIPVTAGAYAAVHLPVNPTGLSLEQVQGGAGLVEGRAVLIVTGSQRNIETGPRPPSDVKVALFDKTGHAVASQTVHVEGGAIPGGDARLFKAVFENPPISSAEFGVDFAFETPKPPPKPHAPAPPVIRSAHLEPNHPPELVKEATALPAADAQALPRHASQQGAGHGPEHASAAPAHSAAEPAKHGE